MASPGWSRGKLVSERGAARLDPEPTRLCCCPAGTDQAGAQAAAERGGPAHAHASRKLSPGCSRARAHSLTGPTCLALPGPQAGPAAGRGQDGAAPRAGDTD